MRKPLSKKIRFEVFKRDEFTCQYCGGTPPKIILQVDHIHPVAEGGNNDIDNLITSCQPCNIGKGANVLSAVPESLKDKAQRVAESEEQLKGYYEVLQERKERVDDEVWRIADIIESGSPQNGMDRGWLGSIRYFLKNLNFYQVEEAAEIARGRFSYGGKKTFLYFCGICHRMIKDQNGTN